MIKPIHILCPNWTVKMVLIPFCTPLNVREGLVLQGSQEEMRSPKLTTKTEKANKNHFRPFSEQACALCFFLCMHAFANLFTQGNEHATATWDGLRFFEFRL